jgi:catechol 2,3-dioxygenase-like lactoylglutathione lyase family enzyme
VPAFLVVALGVALALHMSPSGAGSTVNPAPASTVGAVDGVAITVADMDRSVAFYSTVLFFEKVSDVQTSGPSIDRLLGAAGARVRVVTMRLGAEKIELIEYLGQNGRAMPADTRRDDRALESLAIVVNDMDQAYLWLRRHHVEQTSPEPQRVPDWNPNAGGTRAFFFKDPDGHALEILQFPVGKGDARWQRPSERIFLGIDHTAIVVGDTEKSLKWYRDTLGLRIAGGSESSGPEQERLSSVPGAPLRITTLRAAEGPAIELVEYLAPRDGRPYPRDTMGEDLVRWHTLLVTADVDAVAAKLGAASGLTTRPTLVSTADTLLGFRRGITTEDPDGHAIQLRAREGAPAKRPPESMK